MDDPRITVPMIRQFKDHGRKITAVTAYDVAFARLADAAGMDLILVGDSLGNVVLGYDTTLPVTLDDMVRHTAAVSRGAKRSLIVADLPFMTYQTSIEDAVRSAGRLVQEGGAHAVKLEGGGPYLLDVVTRLNTVGIPAMGHLGWTPQSVNAFGRASVRGRTKGTAQQILDDARALQEAGAFALVLEVIPERLANVISDTLIIPTIGIGAGPGCDGQVLVCYDMLGMDESVSYRHVKRYADVGRQIFLAFEKYREEVMNGAFPERRHSFAMDEDELAGLDEGV
jgi:3-methyl-2-oxobutanoate hydroxymethyltransferase